MSSEDLIIKFQINHFSAISDCCVVLPVVDSSSSSPAPPGGHPGFCQSLQRHLCVLGVRLPAGPHLPDTSLLLGRHQSQLPREQLCLGGAAAALLEGQTHTFYFCLFFFFFFFSSCVADFQTGGVELKETAVCPDSSVCVCVSLRGPRCVSDGFYCTFGESCGGPRARRFSF